MAHYLNEKCAMAHYLAYFMAYFLHFLWHTFPRHAKYAIEKDAMHTPKGCQEVCHGTLPGILLQILEKVCHAKVCNTYARIMQKYARKYAMAHLLAYFWAFLWHTLWHTFAMIPMGHSYGILMVYFC